MRPLRTAPVRRSSASGRGRRSPVQALAYEFGYADQAHFIREFRATVGVTPGAYQAVRA